MPVLLFVNEVHNKRVIRIQYVIALASLGLSQAMYRMAALCLTASEARSFVVPTKCGELFWRNIWFVHVNGSILE